MFLYIPEFLSQRPKNTTRNTAEMEAGDFPNKKRQDCHSTILI
jgi:hypothetical protein